MSLISLHVLAQMPFLWLVLHILTDPVRFVFFLPSLLICGHFPQRKLLENVSCAVCSTLSMSVFFYDFLLNWPTVAFTEEFLIPRFGFVHIWNGWNQICLAFLACKLLLSPPPPPQSHVHAPTSITEDLLVLLTAGSALSQKHNMSFLWIRPPKCHVSEWSFCWCQVCGCAGPMPEFTSETSPNLEPSYVTLSPCRLVCKHMGETESRGMAYIVEIGEPHSDDPAEPRARYQISRATRHPSSASLSGDCSKIAPLSQNQQTTVIS